MWLSFLIVQVSDLIVFETFCLRYYEQIRGVRNQYHLQQHSGTQCFVSARGNYQSSSFNRDSDIGPFWLNMMKEAIWYVIDKEI